MGDTVRRKWGSGSLYQRADGRWIGRIELPRGPDGIRRQKTVSSMEEAEVIAALEGRTMARKRRRPPLVAKLLPAPKRVAQHIRVRYRFARDVLRSAAEEGWTPDYTAHVMLAALTPERVRRRIFGPCHYCGTWLATTVDHVLPRSRGGTNDADNLVSACLVCNVAKNARTPEEWQAA